MTDAATGYKHLGLHLAIITHEVIDHAVAYVNGHIHTNGLENFWSLLKRGIKGTYVSVEPFHLFRYLDEQAAFILTSARMRMETRGGSWKA